VTDESDRAPVPGEPDPASDGAAAENEIETGTNGGTQTETETERPERKAFALLPAAGIFALFLLTILGGLALVIPFRSAGMQAFENPSSLGNVGLIVVEVLVATAVFLFAFRSKRGMKLVRVLVVGGFAVVLQYPFAVLLPASVPAPLVVSVVLSGGLALLLWVFPEWYVIDAAAVTFGAVAVALFGVSLSPLPVLVLLVSMALYDAYSVYVSEHMQSLGEGIVDLKLPMVFVVPTDPSFSLLAVDDLEGLSSGAHLLGLGDAMFPGLLAASGAVFVDSPSVFAGLNAAALGALAGAIVGMTVLNIILFRFRRAHAGLPALNGGVIAGYLVGAAVAGVPPMEAMGLAPYI
jgi:presenilin-like A22 family membrane protease